MAEAGFPGFYTSAWFALLRPPQGAAAIIDKLNRETVRVLLLPDVRKQRDDLGIASDNFHSGRVRRGHPFR